MSGKKLPRTNAKTKGPYIQLESSAPSTKSTTQAQGREGTVDKSPGDPRGQPGPVIHDDQHYSRGAAVRIKWANRCTVLKMVPGSKAAVCLCLLWLVISIVPATYLIHSLESHFISVISFIPHNFRIMTLQVQMKRLGQMRLGEVPSFSQDPTASWQTSAAQDLYFLFLRLLHFPPRDTTPQIQQARDYRFCSIFLMGNFPCSITCQILLTKEETQRHKNFISLLLQLG